MRLQVIEQSRPLPRHAAVELAVVRFIDKIERYARGEL